MTHAEKADWFASLESEGLEVPIEYADPPDLFPDLNLDWKAFMVLSGSRQTGMNGPLNITVSEVLSYCELLGINDPDSRVILLERIQILDSEYMKVISEKQQRNKDGNR